MLSNFFYKTEIRDCRGGLLLPVTARKAVFASLFFSNICFWLEDKLLYISL